MLSGILAISVLAMVVSFAGLLGVGSRWRRAGAWRSLLYGLLVTGGSVGAGLAIGGISRPALEVGASLIFASALAASAARRDWNPPAQAFLGALALTSAAFVTYTVTFTFTLSPSPAGWVANALLLLLEAFAFVLLLLATHETLDTAGRVRWHRRVRPREVDGFQPFVSIHVPTHNEPPEMVLDTLAAIGALDYPAFEVLVIDNNTDEPGLWRPVAEYCERAGFRFVHLEDWPGFKAGALNHGLEICDPRAEIVAVIDADFVVQPDFLRRSVGGFADPGVGIVQTAQAFRADDADGYLRRLELTYRTFDEISMPSRNERNSIIFAGTMGLIRRSALEGAGGWGEWCVTEDAELSLRVLARGYDAIYLEESFGAGVMPLTFAGLKRQRFRWCVGGVQLLRAHWRLLLSGRRTLPDGKTLHLTRAQRYDYLAAALQWFMPLLTVAFAFLLLISVAAHASGHDLAFRPLAGLFVAIPLTFLVTGLVRALWGLRARLRVRWRDSVAVMGIFLGLSWAVALACVQGLFGSGMPFLRTPKFRERERLVQTLRTAGTELVLAIGLTAAAIIGIATWPTPDNLFIAGLCGWSALIFWSAPATAFVASRMELRSSALSARRRLEFKRGRMPSRRRRLGLAYATAVAAAAVGLIIPGLAGSPGDSLRDFFRRPGGGVADSGGKGLSASTQKPAMALRTEARRSGNGTSNAASPGGGRSAAASDSSTQLASATTPTTTPASTTPASTTPGSTSTTASGSAPVDHPTSQPTDPSSTKPTSSPTTPASDHPTGPP
jgi:cellulose synthase/poly-beta-1,6-N-acetylglucosamine synthase-like glycosyltransferase